MLFKKKTQSNYARLKQVSMPPSSKPFDQMNGSEAEDFFAWHLRELPSRLHNMGVILDFELSYTPDSLAELWEKLIGYHKRCFNRLHLSRGEREKFENLLCCAGLYLAEVFVKNNPEISWACNTETQKGDYFYNKPVLIGFSDTSVSPPFCMVFEPYHMIHVQAVKIEQARIAKPNDLLELYEKWCEHIR